MVQQDEGATSHYLIVTYPSWAHIRSEIGLSANLLQHNSSLYLTILIPANRALAAELEINQYPSLITGLDEDRVVICRYGDDHQQGGQGMYNPRGGFREWCEKYLDSFASPLSNLEPLKDSITGEKVIPHQIPISVIITDMTLARFGAPLRETIAKNDRKKPLLLGFGPYNTATFADLFLKDYAAIGERIQKAHEAGEGQSEDRKLQLYNEVIGENEDVIHTPGLWPYHVFELNPVEKESLYSRLSNFARMTKLLPTIFDGLIAGWPHALGKNLQEPIQRLFKHFYQVGPLLPPEAKDEWAVESTAGDCKIYLDRALQESGPNSVLYISFGSVLFPPNMEQLNILLDVLAESRTRYIIAEGTNTSTPPEVKEQMEKTVGRGSDKGLLVPWAPQKAILNHPATGAFLSHGGSNSAMEGILACTPMIIWPAGFDQPSIANELDYLGVARELIQIRWGPNVGRSIARDVRVVEGTSQAIHDEMRHVISTIFGSGQAGNKIRSRVREVKEMLCEDMKDGSGGSWQAIETVANLGDLHP